MNTIKRLQGLKDILQAAIEARRYIGQGEYLEGHVDGLRAGLKIAVDAIEREISYADFDDDVTGGKK